MITRFTNPPARPRRGVATAVTALASAAASHTSAGVDRVLQIDVHVTAFHQHRVELESFGAHDRYLLISQYGKHRKLDYRSWQKDTIGGREHAVKQVAISPDRQRYTVRTSGIAPLPAVSFGVLSTRAQVAQAIQDGAAHEEGLGMKDGQRIRLLTLASGKGVRSASLYVNPLTLAPVASTVAYMTKGGTIRVVSAHWENASANAVNTLESAPKVPATYRVTHS